MKILKRKPIKGIVRTKQQLEQERINLIINITIVVGWIGALVAFFISQNFHFSF